MPSLNIKLQFPHLEFAIFKGSLNSATKNALNQCTSESTRGRQASLIGITCNGIGNYMRSFLNVFTTTSLKEDSMNRITKAVVIALATGALLSGCATPPKTAVKKTYVAEGQNLVFGGFYRPDEKEVTITVNDDPVLKGRFSPFTPTQNLNGSYKNLQISAHYYFGTVLGSRGGKVGLIAGIVQSANNKSADKCDVSVNSKPAETLFF